MAAHGYVTDTSYTDNFFRELSPVWLNYAAAVNGVTPRRLDRPFAYLELGCGFGTSAVANAAAFPQGAFHACDINAVHIAGGREHAAALGVSNLAFHESDFEALVARDLPPFDFIVLHGVYSWVDAVARAAIRRIISATLKPGGLVYVSYNCLPGWASEAPLRRLLVEVAAAEQGDTARRARHALAVLTSMSAAKLRYFRATPAAVIAVEAYNKGSGAYLVHEFLNEAWEPFYSIDVADEMAEAGVRYAGSATLTDNHHALVVDAQAAEALAGLPTDRLRQLATDFAVNQRFRRDVFVREPRAAAAAAGAATSDDAVRLVYETVVGCVGNPEKIATKATVPRGEVTFQDDFIVDVRALMARGSTTIGDAVAALRRGTRRPQEIARNLLFLVAAGVLTPFAKAHAVGDSATRRPVATPMLERGLAYVIEHGARRPIASEVLGNGLPLAPDDARAVRDALAGDLKGNERASELLGTLSRVGLIA